MFGAMSPRMKSRGLGRAARVAVTVAVVVGSAGCWELRSGPLVAADAADRETIMPADVGTTSDVDVVDVADVAGPDSGNAPDVTLIDAPVVDVTLMDASSLDAASGDVTVVDTAAVVDSAMDVPGVDTPIADAGSTSDATTVDTGSVIDSAVADMGTPVVCGSGSHLCGSSCVSDTAVTSCGSSCTACAVPTGGSATCSAGACGQSCPGGTSLCVGACVSLATNTSHCGACGTVCAAGQSCVSGVCMVTTSSGQRSCTPTVTGCGLVEVTGGTFTMGEATVAYRASPVQPVVTVGSFALDAYEVTVARFNAFWAVRAASLGPIRSAPIAYPGGQSIAWGAAAADPLPQDMYYNWSASSTTRDAHPMNGVDWWLSQEFCVWDGGRLPTEAEWEYAARGRAVEALSSGRIYPWGDTPIPACDRVQISGCAGTDGGVTRRVGSFAASAGLFDMAGNVFEWTADNYAAYSTGGSSACGHPSGLTNALCNNNATGLRVYRGGSWDFDVAYLRAASRYGSTPAGRFNGLGFRCARTR